MTPEEKASAFINGWVVGYLKHGGKLTDDGLAEECARAYERYLHPPDLPEAVDITLREAIAAATS